MARERAGNTVSFLRRKPKRVPGEYPERFTRAFVQQTLPTATPREAQSTINHLRSKGWSEQKLAQYVLPYMPPPGTPDDMAVYPAAPAPSEPPPVPVPEVVTQLWIDQQLPALTPRQITHVVEELEQRGWTPREVAIVALPHLLPKLPKEDQQSLLAGLTRIGLSGEEVGRLRRGH